MDQKNDGLEDAIHMPLLELITAIRMMRKRETDSHPFVPIGIP